MGEESAVLEVGMATQEPDFDYQQYVQYFPPEVADILVEVFQKKPRGWIKKRNLVRNVAKFTEQMEGSVEALIESCKPITRSLSERDHGQKFLEGLSEDGLRRACDMCNVNYGSFMNSGDKDGLIQSILDEMERQE